MKNQYINHHMKTKAAIRDGNKAGLLDLAKKYCDKVGAAQIGSGFMIVDTRKFKVIER